MKRLSPSSLTLSLTLYCPSISLSVIPPSAVSHYNHLSHFFSSLVLSFPLFTFNFFFHILFLSIPLIESRSVFLPLFIPTLSSASHLFSIYVICSSFIISLTLCLCLPFPPYLPQPPPSLSSALYSLPVQLSQQTTSVRQQIHITHIE